MERTDENSNSICAMPDNLTNDVSSENGNQNENVGVQQTNLEKKEATQEPPKLILLHDEVKDHIKSYVEQKGYSDVTLDVELGSDLGDNFMGFIGKLTVSGVNHQNERKTFKWIVKTAPDIEPYRTMLNVTMVYERESFIYKDVFKIYRDFQNEKNVLEPFDHYPEYVLSYLDNMKETIVMNDMKSVGYVMRPRQETLDLNHVKLVMKTYGKLHAMSYVLKDQKPDVFKKLSENTKDILKEMLLSEGVVEAFRPMMEATLIAVDPEKDPKIYPLYKKYVDNYMHIVPKLLEDTNDASVIGHGDSWINNMLWKYDKPDSTIPTKVCLLDFQVARYGSPFCDLSYFIFTSTTKEFRDKHYDDMIRLYYYTLCAHVNEMGTDPEKYLSFDTLQEEIKKYSLFGLYPIVSVLGIITRDTSEIPEWRSGEANQEEMQEEWTKTSVNVDLYKERARGVLIDYYEKGYLNSLM